MALRGGGGRGGGGRYGGGYGGDYGGGYGGSEKDGGNAADSFGFSGIGTSRPRWENLMFLVIAAIALAAMLPLLIVMLLIGTDRTGGWFSFSKVLKQTIFCVTAYVFLLHGSNGHQLTFTSHLHRTIAFFLADYILYQQNASLPGYYPVIGVICHATQIVADISLIGILLWISQEIYPYGTLNQTINSILLRIVGIIAVILLAIIIILATGVIALHATVAGLSMSMSTEILSGILARVSAVYTISYSLFIIELTIFVLVASMRGQSSTRLNVSSPLLSCISLWSS